MTPLPARRAVAPLVLAIVLVLASMTGSRVAADEGAADRSPGPHAATGTAARAAAPGAPNVVLFLTDDMRLDDLTYMPAVRRLLAKRGTRFTHAFSSDPLCCPARATLLTGLYAHNHKTMGNHEERYGGWYRFSAENDVSDLLGSWLQDAGYRTFFMGKYLNQFHGGGQPGWDYWQVPVKGIYNYTRWTAVVRRPGGTDRTRRYGGGSHYQQSVQRATLQRWVRRWSAEDRPFFAWAGSLAPHTAAAPGKFTDPIPESRYAHLRVPRLARTAAFNERDVSDKPAWVGWADRKSYRFHNRRHRQRIRALRSVDATVARTVRTLREEGELRHTLLVFTSDNGFLLGEHGLGKKNVGYQEAVRIPLVIRGPGFTPGTTAAQPVSLADVAATVVAATGATPGHPLDGVPLAGFEDDPTLHRDRPVLVEGSASDLPGGSDLATDDLGRFYWGAVTRRWTYVRYADQPDVSFRSEFYDRKRRGGKLQVRNQWRSDAPPGSPQDRLVRWVAAAKDCAGASCQLPLGP